MHTQSVLAICDPMDYIVCGAPPWIVHAKYQSGLPFPPPGDLLEPANPRLLHWQVDSLLPSHLGIPICMYISLYLSIDGHLGCFHILAVVNNAAINMRVQIYFQVKVFIFFG